MKITINYVTNTSLFDSNDPFAFAFVIVSSKLSDVKLVAELNALEFCITELIDDVDEVDSALILCALFELK